MKSKSLDLERDKTFIRHKYDAFAINTQKIVALYKFECARFTVRVVYIFAPIFSFIIAPSYIVLARELNKSIFKFMQ